MLEFDLGGLKHWTLITTRAPDLNRGGRGRVGSPPSLSFHSEQEGLLAEAAAGCVKWPDVNVGKQKNGSWAGFRARRTERRGCRKTRGCIAQGS